MSSITYGKRLRMEIDLAWIDPVPPLPFGYVWVPWADEVLQAHAEVKWRSFRGELDTAVFPNLASRDGCLYLMRTIRDQPGFVPESTWLIEAEDGCCGTIQGIRDDMGPGMLQNVGVVGAYRGLGLGGTLVLTRQQSLSADSQSTF